ncbi:acetyl-CoA synthetase-like protein [Rhizodiscina lignyota]|uniref:Acetyl-CoA synthetase-like protein n=1 Tax=Rhizodiscina lignyota TaxID=1504668 RepID=A0A9P4IA75_9PEZI|nr:acetyl-CoA synthetase-like protein [Rhizodiscina lignyota]
MRKQRSDTGRRLLPHVLDELADEQPHRVLYEVPVKNDVTVPFAKITTRQFADAVNRAAWWFEETLGRADEFPTVGYLGPGDLRYFILVIASIKAGYKILYISPRNSVEGDVAVIEATDCKIWLKPSRGTNIERVLDRVPLQLYDLPDIGHFLNDNPSRHYPYDKSWEEGKRDPAWILHTSGSTGNPKPVRRYLDSIASSDANTALPAINGRPLLLHDYFDSRAYLTFPLFHAAGLSNGLLWPLFYGTTVVLGPERPVTLDIMKEVIIHSKVDAVFTAPSIVQDISQDEEFLKILENVNAIAYGGGPVSKEAGDRIIPHTKLVLSIGTTETGWLPCVETDREDWNYIHFHPYGGLEFQDRGGGLYELVAVRRPELELWQPIFSTFPDQQEYSFKDLFSKHPTKPDLFTFEGRADNVLVLSNGEKVQPHNMELTIAAHPAVSAVVVSGQGRFQTSLLVELLGNPPHISIERHRIIDELWPWIEDANISAPSHAQLLKEYILFATPDKPFSKTSKGTVRRGPTLELYKKELDDLYAQADSSFSDTDADVPQLNSADEQTFRDGVRKAFESVTGIVNLPEDADFFTAAGIDSLQVLTLQKYLRKGLVLVNGERSAVSTALIYQNPTISLLSRTLYQLVSAPHSNGHIAYRHSGPSPVQQLFESLFAELPNPPRTVNGVAKIQSRREGHIIILTGSTGSLGSYVLNDLMNSGTVEEIWCLNRSADSESRQKASNAQRGLRTDFHNRRVFFRQATLWKDNLGLDYKDYLYLLKNATQIIHTQWQVDFNLALTSFSTHLRGVKNLISLCLAASSLGNTIQVFFTSSVGIANKLTIASSIPEAPFFEDNVASSGYGQSKLVAEKLLLESSDKLGVNATVCRVGQIAGPVKQTSQSGLWNRKEWLPSIVEASAQLALFPRTLGTNEYVDWIPVDILSSIIVELALQPSDDGEGGKVFHCVNPSPVPWEQRLLPVAQARLSQSLGEKEVQAVPFDTWIEALRQKYENDDSKGAGRSLSAFSLLDFYTGLTGGGEKARKPLFETDQTRKQSKYLAELPGVTAEWMDIWLQQWGY